MSTTKPKRVSSIMRMFIAITFAAIVFQLAIPAREPKAVRMTKEEATKALHEVSRMKHAVIFALLRWEHHAIQRKRFEEIANQYRTTPGKPQVHFVVIDFTSLSNNYEPFSNWEGATELTDRKQRAPLHSVDRMFWVANGKILDSAATYDFPSAVDAIERTVKLFTQNN